MDETNENINSENESRRDNSDTRVAGTRFGQNLWLEVERWRRHQPNMKRNLRNETNHQSEACSSSVSYDGQDCVPSSSKKARYVPERVTIILIVSYSEYDTSKNILNKNILDEQRSKIV